MPGSTTGGGEQEPPKAKDATSNGIFVRPVAVAGIFRPSSGDTKPALPEKRRFSALVGDLRPCSLDTAPTATAEDFARRRQSWDARQAAPFGQNLLRRTSKDVTPSKPIKKIEDATIKEEVSSPNSVRSSINSSCSSLSSTDKLIHSSDSSIVDSKNTSSDSINHSVQVSASSKACSSDLSDATKVVVAKTETRSRQTNESSTANISSCARESDTLAAIAPVNRIRSRQTTNESSAIEISSCVRESDTQDAIVPVHQTRSRQTNESSATKISSRVHESDTQTCIQPVHRTRSRQANESPDAKISCPESDTRAIAPVHQNRSRQTNESSATKISSHESDIQTVTAEVHQTTTKKVSAIDKQNIKTQEPNSNDVSKILDINNSSSEISKPKKVYGLIKRETKTENTVQETVTTERKNSSEISVSQPVKNTAKVFGVAKTNTQKETEKESLKTTEANLEISSGAKIINSRKEDNKRETSPQKLLSHPVSSAEKSKDLSKPEPLPEEFRTVRRTSNVIAAKIQNIFSNVASEKPPPILARKAKLPDNDKTNPAALIKTATTSDNKPTELKENKDCGANKVELKKPNVDIQTETNLKTETHNNFNTSNQRCAKEQSISKEVKTSAQLESVKPVLANEPKVINNCIVTSKISDPNTYKSDNSSSSCVNDSKNINREFSEKSSAPNSVKTGSSVPIVSIPNGIKSLPSNKTSSNEIKSDSANNIKRINPVLSEKPSDHNAVKTDSSMLKANDLNATRIPAQLPNKISHSDKTSKTDSLSSTKIIDTKATKVVPKPSNTNVSEKMVKTELENSETGCKMSISTSSQKSHTEHGVVIKMQEQIKQESRTVQDGNMCKTVSTTTKMGSVEKNMSICSKVKELQKSTINTNQNESTVILKDGATISKSINNTCNTQTVMTTCNGDQKEVKTISTTAMSASSSTPKNPSVSDRLVNGNVDSKEATTKVEITKISPTVVQGIVPTVNVMFRTKSPSNSKELKEENRKKVIVSNVDANLNGSHFDQVKTITDKVQPKASKPVLDNTAMICSDIVIDSRVPSSEEIFKNKTIHNIINLKKEEVASVELSPKSEATTVASIKHATDKPLTPCPRPDVTTAISSTDKPLYTSSTRPDGATVITPRHATDISPRHATDKPLSPKPDITTVLTPRLTADKPLSPRSDTTVFYPRHATDKPLSPRPDFTTYSSSTLDRLSLSPTHKTNGDIQIVDLDSWSRKFQLPEEAPRVPLRRRAPRDSLPPSSMPLRTSIGSRIGSLKRMDIPRSPSQSSMSLPYGQRYSYTEMLSKVCSLGVLPTTDHHRSFSPNYRSCSSSSSQVSELWSDLSEEQSAATHATEMLDAETTERMRLEKEVQELQSRYSHMQQRSDKMELEMMEARVYRTELNGDLSEEDVEANSSIYKQKYERAVRDMEMMKRRIQQQHEEDMEQKQMVKKATDKRLAEALEDVEEERQVANQWKRKAQKLGSELQDIRMMLEEQMARNGELEKKQRRFDSELSAAQEEIKKERLQREKLSREKDQALHEKYSIEQDLQSTRIDMDMQHEKITQLNRELDELTLSSKGEEEVTQLKRAKQELERKSRDQEEELEEFAAQVQMLEQAKLRLEMSLEKLRQEHRRESSVKEEEIEEIRASSSKKIKSLEAQLEAEQDERHQLVKQKHELERRIYEITDQPPPQDPEIERRLRRDLKRTKALLRDAQSMLEHTRDGQANKTLIRQLKNQLEDAEFAKSAAVKARQAADSELQDLQMQLEEVTRTKNESESRTLQLSRERSAIQTQLEETEEEMAEVMKKYKAVVAQMSIDQKSMVEQTQQIADLEAERQMLKDQLSEVSHKFEHLAGQSEDAHKILRLDGKIRELESKLELEQTTRGRLESQISRLKELNDRAREECDSLRNKELQAQEGVRRLQRQIRELREDYAALQQKEADGYRKQHELEVALENTDADLQVTKNDLRLACQRIQDLQNALEEDLDSGTDVPDDSGSDSDSSYEMSLARMTPIQRCDSVSSNFSLDMDGRRSRNSSFSQELSAFSRMMLRRTSMDFLG